MSSGHVLSIVGCGSVGEALLQLFSLKMLEDTNSKFESVELIDPDLVSTSDKYLMYPKVFEVEDKIKKINPDLKIKSIHSKAIFPECVSHRDNYNNLFVDCRDTSEQSDLCCMKICSDGPYGKIILYPDTITGLPTNYRIKKSNYYALLTASTVIEKIFKFDVPYKKENTEKVISINHTVSF